jgi:hypothetical protein
MDWLEQVDYRFGPNDEIAQEVVAAPVRWQASQ